jgi:hypothetical protein
MVFELADQLDYVVAADRKAMLTNVREVGDIRDHLAHAMFLRDGSGALKIKNSRAASGGWIHISSATPRLAAKASIGVR